jgi:hypothetical protein
MSVAELLAGDEPATELEALVAAIEAADAHEDAAPSEPAPIEPGPAQPAVCIWRGWDATAEEWRRCDRRARWLLGFVVNRKASREAYCLPHALLCLREERIKPAKVWSLGRGRA